MRAVKYSKEKAELLCDYDDSNVDRSKFSIRKMFKLRKITVNKALIFALSAILLCTIVAIAVGLTIGLKKDTERRPEPTYPSSSYKKFSSYVVATDTTACSKIGKNILEKNGSAVDAAIAAMFCVGIICPHSAGIGGGFVAVIYDTRRSSSKKELTTLFARERAPLNSNENMFSSDSSVIGGLAVAVPGQIKGFYEAWKEFGKLPWKDLVQPTTDLLENGFVIEESLAKALQDMKGKLFPIEEFREVYFQNDEPLRKGDIAKDLRLADTLKKISNSPDAFYNESLSNTIVKEIKDSGGIVSNEDLSNYEIEWKEPIEIPFGNAGDRYFSMRPPCSGVVLALIFNILKNYNFTSYSVKGDSKVLTYHRILEAFRFAFAGRSNLGDEKFVNVTEIVSNMLSSDFAENLRTKIDDSSTKEPSYYESEFSSKQDGGTAHLSVLASDGSVVSMTSTINTRFGSLVKGPVSGIIYNNEMDDFSSPNLTNFFGFPPSPNNFIRPGKIPMSSMSPSLILDQHNVARFVTGASGGSRIITAIAWVMMNSLWFEKPLGEATDSPRLHNQLLPDQTTIESWMDAAISEGLENKGHKTVLETSLGIDTSIRNRCLNSGEKLCIEAVGDGRKGGEPDGL